MAQDVHSFNHNQLLLKFNVFVNVLVHKINWVVEAVSGLDRVSIILHRDLQLHALGLWRAVLEEHLGIMLCAEKEKGEVRLCGLYHQ